MSKSEENKEVEQEQPKQEISVKVHITDEGKIALNIEGNLSMVEVIGLLEVGKGLVAQGNDAGKEESLDELQ